MSGGGRGPSTAPLRAYERTHAPVSCARCASAQPRRGAVALAAELLALLGDRTRLTLLHALAGGEADVTTLTDACGAARPAVSQHLARLRLAGLVTTRKEGRRVVYALQDGHLRRLLEEALNVADRRIGDRPPHD